FDLINPIGFVTEDFLSQELQLVGSYDTLEWIVGAYYAQTSGNETVISNSLRAISTTAPNYFDGDVDSETQGYFGQATYNLTDTLRVTAGLRWSEESKKLVSFNRNARGCTVAPVYRVAPGVCESRPFENDFSDWSYLASVDWQPFDAVMLYARTARGFRGGGQNMRGNVPGTFDPFEP